MGQPVFKIMDFIRENGIQVFSSNYILYGDMSDRVMETLRACAPSIEIYSIDEAFLNLDSIDNSNLKKYGEELASIVKRNTGIPVSIGISHTKTLAKVASKLGKKYPKLNGSCFMQEDCDIRKVLKVFPVGDVWGIGREHGKMLNQNKIMTAYDFSMASSEWVKKKMSVVGLRTWLELRGIPSISFEDSIHIKKQICTSRSFSHELNDIEELSQAVATFTTYSAEKLRKQDSVCSSIQIFILTNQYKEKISQYFRSIIVTLDTPTDSTLILVKAALSGLCKIYKSECMYKKAGVVLLDISKKNDTPGNIFCDHNAAKHSMLMETLDGLNLRYGRDTLVTAAQGIESIKAFSNHLSKRYTTCWDDIIEVNI